MAGGTYTVNGADVVCGNVQTANATVSIINSVLMPKEPSRVPLPGRQAFRAPPGSVHV
jgi:hypothetical protein